MVTILVVFFYAMVGFLICFCCQIVKFKGAVVTWTCLANT